MKTKNNWIWILLPILALTAVSSLVSLVTPGLYYRDSTTIATKSYYLDWVHLVLVVPLGIVMFILAIRGRVHLYRHRDIANDASHD